MTAAVAYAGGTAVPGGMGPGVMGLAVGMDGGRVMGQSVPMPMAMPTQQMPQAPNMAMRMPPGMAFRDNNAPPASHAMKGIPPQHASLPGHPGHPLPPGNPGPNGTRDVYRDVVEELLTRFTLLVELSGDGAMLAAISPASWQVICGSPAFRAVAGHGVRVHPEDQTSYVMAHRQAKDGRVPYTRHYRMLTLSNVWRWMCDHVRPSFSRGRFLGCTVHVSDITELKKSEEKLRIITSMPRIFIVENNLNEQLINVNKSYADALGYSPEELKGKFYKDIVYPEDLQRVPSVDQQRRNDLPASHPVRVRCADGGYRWTRWEMALHNGVTYSIGYELHSGVEVEEALLETNYALQKSEATVRNHRVDIHHVAQMIEGGVFKLRLNKDGDIEFEFVNKWLANLVGTTPAALERDPTPLWHAMSDANARDEFRNFVLECQASGRSAKKTFSILNHAGRKASVSVELKPHQVEGQPPSEDGVVPCVSPTLYGCMVDVSDQKEREDELRVARDAAESASKIKTEFLKRMSLALRKPMITVMHASKVLMSTNLSSDQEVYVATMHTCGQMLLAVINSILDFRFTRVILETVKPDFQRWSDQERAKKKRRLENQGIRDSESDLDDTTGSEDSKDDGSGEDEDPASDGEAAENEDAVDKERVGGKRKRMQLKAQQQEGVEISLSDDEQELRKSDLDVEAIGSGSGDEQAAERKDTGRTVQGNNSDSEMQDRPVELLD